jgi:hypothetical protein
MANRTASIVVRGTVDGKRVNWSLKRAKQQGLTGSYWIKWRNGDNQTWDGPHKDEWTAKAAKATMTWAQRTARYGITPETFQAAPGKGCAGYTTGARGPNRSGETKRESVKLLFTLGRVLTFPGALAATKKVRPAAGDFLA